MIQRLRLRDFQCHEDLKIALAPGVTTFVGPSDSGKSAIVRALRWVILNKPRGIGAYMRHNSDGVRVDMWTEKHHIVRGVAADWRGYELDGKDYQAVGSDVPGEIRAAIGIDELNFQFQHDGPFWLSLTPGAVAQEINQVVDLAAIDTINREVSSGVREAGQQKTSAQEARGKRESELNRLSWVDDFCDDVDQFTEAEIDLNTKLNRHRKLNELIGTCRGNIALFRQKQKKAVELEETYKASRGCVEFYQTAYDIAQKAKKLKTAAQRVARSQQKTKDLQENADRLHLATNELMTYIEEQEKAKELKQKAAKLSRAIGQIRHNKNEAAAQEELAAAHKAHFKDEIEENGCPLCEKR